MLPLPLLFPTITFILLLHNHPLFGDLGGCRADGIRVWPLWLLLDGERAPIVETGDHGWIGVHDGFF
jgi:hypothetical protein